jgi:hypothetical protein
MLSWSTFDQHEQRNSMARRRSINVKSRKQSSRITNGSALFLPGVDGRSSLARRARDVFDNFCRDLGGYDILSEAQTQLCRRAAMISIKCEEMESHGANGEQIDLDVFGKLTDRLGRCLERLGIKRVPRDVTPTLAQYIAGVEAE